MIKYLLSIFIFLQFFMINIHAQNTSKENDFYKQKYYEEKFLILNRDIISKELEIKELRSELKSLEEQFNQNNIDKESIMSTFLNAKEIIERQDKRLEDLNFYLALYGFLITVLLFTASYLSYRFTAGNARKIVQDWIKENKEEILTPIRKEAKDLQKNIEDKALKLYQEQLKQFKIEDKLNESQKQTQNDILEKVNEILENKEKEDYTFDDWYSKHLSLMNQNEYSKSLRFIEKAIRHATNDVELVRAMYSKAELFDKQEKYKSANNIYTDIIQKFDNSKNEIILEYVGNGI